MRIRLISAAFFLAALAAPVSAQTADPVFAPEAVKAHVDFLADDLLEGRETGTRGYDLAARYVATRFEALGLVPGGPNGSWYQQVPFVEYRPDPAKPAFVTIGGKRFDGGVDVIVPATGVAGMQALTGGAVFVGHGLERDYGKLDVKGKFVVALLGTPQGLSKSAAAAAAAEDKVANARKHGALGLISLVSPGALKDGFPWGRYATAMTRARTSWVDAQGNPAGEAPVQFYAKDSAATALFAGAANPAERLFAELAKGKRPLGFPLVPTVSVTRENSVTAMPSPNVVGILPGSDPRLSAEYVVLSAHLDHLGIRSGDAPGDKIYNGAMDNAAGVATMLEAARAFVESGKRPRRSILFVALTGEEEGLLGSGYLAQHPVTGNGRVVADVNLDMPILLYDFTDVVAFGAEHSTLGPIVEAAAAKMGVKLSPDPLPEENLFVRSDHYSFVKAGVPSVFLVTGFANGGEAVFRDFLANHYHKVSDQPDLPFDWKAGAKFARINYLIAREIADGAEAPRWYEGNLYGDRFAPGQPRAKKPAPMAGVPAVGG
ncbi:M20/M25/M40 family metallo-hydrolase [Sphingomonas sp.]|uniref:M20/M25/M40 family metallo-hydrolase n=1 Tax=Sphingomonas sp. TaxID=28214 RepID=UPI001B2F7262|nr:M20/M25/M40 family metallo-hydrolase [Sphingomonas sp.]MBO9713123.1 M20/M25/M40 family metallo-hydrolase [Sphingomonas sp.]